AVLGEDNPPDTVAERGHAPRRQRRRLGGDHRLHRAATAEEHAEPLIDEENDRPVALLRIDPQLRLTEPGGGLPVDRAHVIALVVPAQLRKLEPAPAEP